MVLRDRFNVATGGRLTAEAAEAKDASVIIAPILCLC